mmetsp:Transcript_45406/g.98827  ORF Transcript_45406/g.98827 Transcript_45406/m.98827 type:complete len:318 (+) Transcript_45406:193-1146(+)
MIAELSAVVQTPHMSEAQGHELKRVRPSFTVCFTRIQALLGPLGNGCNTAVHTRAGYNADSCIKHLCESSEPSEKMAVLRKPAEPCAQSEGCAHLRSSSPSVWALIPLPSLPQIASALRLGRGCVVVHVLCGDVRRVLDDGGLLRRLARGVHRVDIVGAEELGQRVDAQRHQHGDEHWEEALDVGRKRYAKDGDQDDELQRGELVDGLARHRVQAGKAARVEPLAVGDEEEDAREEGVAAKRGDAHVEKESVERGDGDIADNVDDGEREADKYRLRQRRDALLVAADDHLHLGGGAVVVHVRHSPLPKSLFTERVGM